ncbi:MAG: ATP-binding protein [Akkermansiaceae bacterium]
MVPHLPRLSYWALTYFLIVFINSVGARTPVIFSDVEATHHAGDNEDLKHTIDGVNVSASGWSLGEELDKPQSIIFTLASPIEADLIELSLSFMSGRPHASFAEFSISYTSDAIPRFEGEWNTLPLLNFSATSTTLFKKSGNRLRATKAPHVMTGNTPDEIYRISSRLLGKPVTGLKIEVFPVPRARNKITDLVMAWTIPGDFVLTEFRLEVISTTTNVALGAEVTTTHPLYISPRSGYVEMLPGALTDGWPSTIAHPAHGTPTKGFHFEIDLGQQRKIDHLSLRQRGNNYSLERFSKMRIKLYDQDPKEGSSPIWETLNHPDGSFPAMGEVDVLHADSGKGEFRGRYIRISSESQIPLSPMLAELEVYETRTPQLVALFADSQNLYNGNDSILENDLEIPPNIRRLGFKFNIPQTGQPLDQLFRWKLAGETKDWQISNSLLLEIPCPPAGEYNLVIQASHSDGAWDTSVLRLSFIVEAKFTQTSAFLWLIAASTLITGVIVTRYLSRHQIRLLEASSALEAERSRIAANMHDDVGARIAQLAVLQDVFAIEHDLTNEAKSDLSTMSASMRETMSSLNETVWAVNPKNNTLAALSTFLMQHADSYLSPIGISCKIISPNTWAGITFKQGIRHEVALAYKEALQNIVKHSKATNVEITLSHQCKLFIIKIADDGIGLPDETAGPGHYGLKNMRRRLADTGGSCAWFPREPCGTIVEMKLPLN